MDEQPYDYSSSGLDNFLSRGLDDVAMANLDSQGPVSRQIAYDRTQVTGSLGDKAVIGRIVLDGVEGSITVLSQDGNSANVYLGPKR